ncbi:MAG: VOC family protein [Acidimicrobiia bacterium]|nr:VOC family protein [Acidimicrobiia bacterium]
MRLTGFVHANVNCSDFEVSRAFYERLGFEVVWEVPRDGGADVAAAVGMEPYRVRGAVMALGGDPRSTMIDLLEWQRPNDAEPPYPHLYHLGIARLAFSTADLAADVAALEAAGVTFVGPPVRIAGPTGDGVSFVCFHDPDGTVLELVEYHGPPATPGAGR